ncbi:hypothetical protein R3P38DRAFT_3188612 [Favolaschia claudopus]|uniref:Uncharacterized protein n=1 Tax=Favolaschia claudopus TaxID=2862362 RepID=A0AAW0BTW1_9AGAR
MPVFEHATSTSRRWLPTHSVLITISQECLLYHSSNVDRPPDPGLPEKLPVVTPTLTIQGRDASDNLIETRAQLVLDSALERMEAIFGRIRELSSWMPIDSKQGQILTPDRRHLAQRVKNLMKTGDLIVVRKLVEKVLDTSVEEVE